MCPRCVTFSPLTFDPPRFGTPHEPSTEAMATPPAPILASDSVFAPAVPRETLPSPPSLSDWPTTQPLRPRLLSPGSGWSPDHTGSCLTDSAGKSRHHADGVRRVPVVSAGAAFPVVDPRQRPAVRGRIGRSSSVCKQARDLRGRRDQRLCSDEPSKRGGPCEGSPHPTQGRFRCSRRCGGMGPSRRRGCCCATAGWRRRVATDVCEVGELQVSHSRVRPPRVGASDA